MRAAAAANQLQKLPTPLPLAGVVLMGQALNIIEFSQRPANVTSYIVSLPTIAAIAWYHGKAQTDGKDFQGFMDEVQLFARAETSPRCSRAARSMSPRANASPRASSITRACRPPTTCRTR